MSEIDWGQVLDNLARGLYTHEVARHLTQERGPRQFRSKSREERQAFMPGAGDVEAVSLLDDPIFQLSLSLGLQGAQAVQGLLRRPASVPLPELGVSSRRTLPVPSRPKPDVPPTPVRIKPSRTGDILEQQLPLPDEELDLASMLEQLRQSRHLGASDEYGAYLESILNSLRDRSDLHIPGIAPPLPPSRPLPAPRDILLPAQPNVPPPWGRNNYVGELLEAIKGAQSQSDRDFWTRILQEYLEQSGGTFEGSGGLP